MVTITNIISSLSDIYGMLRTLDGVEPLFLPSGKVDYYVGNMSLACRVKFRGEESLLKCYISSHPHLKVIYGERYFRDELLVFTLDGRREWIDVVIDSWRDGRTLLKEVEDCAARGAQDELETLAQKFDSLALELLSQEWAHGDLTLENIIVSPDGKLHLIDFDAMYLPELSSKGCYEIGTDAFQHPERDAESFNKSIDDYSIALISTGLHLVALAPQLLLESNEIDGFIFYPYQIVYSKSELYNRCLETFARSGMTIQYRIAEMLTSRSYILPNLKELLDFTLNRGVSPEPCELFVEDGQWGYRSLSGQVVIPAIYDAGFDFSCSVAAVKQGGFWHYINSHGEVVMNCSDCEAIKPALDNMFRIRRGGVWYNYCIPEK